MAAPTRTEQLELAKTYCPDLLTEYRRMELALGGTRGPIASIVKEVKRGTPDWIRQARREIMSELLAEWEEAWDADC